MTSRHPLLRRWLSAALGRAQASPYLHAPAAAPTEAPASEAALEARVRERTQELRLALDVAEASSRAKSQFLSNLGHEIRTPMNGVMGMAQLLANTSLDTTQRGYIELMQRSASHLIGLLDQLLDFSRIESGAIELQPQAVPLRALLDETAEVAAAQALDKQLLFECHLAPDLPATVHADMARLRQVVTNLLSNALKFTSVGQVVLAARQDLEGLVIEVVDTGIGVSRELQQLVFAPFVQADEGMARRHGGIGLGLPIADALVRAMGGRIEVVSEPGRGATFRVHLRLPVLESATPPARGRRRRVAVVSDAPSSQQSLRDRFLYLQHECVAVLSWRDLAFAPESLAGTRPDVVVYDEPLNGWPHHAPLAGPAEPWGVLLLCRRPGSAGVLPCLTRPFTDGSLARALDPAIAVAVPAPAPLASGVRGRVLLVEDHEINQVVARSFLEHLGFDVDVAADAPGAFDALRSRDYALVVMDCQMPGMDGYELTRRLRGGEAGVRAQRAPIIALTAHATPNDRERCLAAGMNDYIAKPVNPHVLGSTIERWLTPAR